MSPTWILALPLALSVTTATADEPLRVGIIAGAGTYRVSDPAGPTSAANAPDVGVVATMDWARDARLLFQGHYQQFTLDAGTRNIGQHVKRVGVSASYQHLLRLTRDWKPWLGVGLEYTRETDSLRHTIDSGGFLAATYPDRSNSPLSAVLSASTEWAWTRDWDLGFSLQYDAALGANATTALVLDFVAVYALR